MTRLRLLPPLGLALLLAACAPLTPQTAPPAEKRYAAAELRALQPGDLAWPATSTDGERAAREAAVADIRARLALPPGPERDAALPRLFDLVAQYNAEIDAARPVLLQALPTLATRDAEYQRALLTAAHTLYAPQAAPLLWPLLPQLTAQQRGMPPQEDQVRVRTAGRVPGQLREHLGGPLTLVEQAVEPARPQIDPAEPEPHRGGLIGPGRPLDRLVGHRNHIGGMPERPGGHHQRDRWSQRADHFVQLELHRLTPALRVLML